MGDFAGDLRLADAGAEPLLRAVEAVLAEHSGAAKLRAGAVETVEGGGDGGAAVYFQSLLELAYLVASADGLAAGERAALARLVEHATASAVERDALLVHFDDLEAGSETLGRRERLVRTAANVEGEAQSEAIRFATLVAIADGTLADAEAAVLRELGAHFSLDAGQVQAVIDEVAAAIRDRLGGDR